VQIEIIDAKNAQNVVRNLFALYVHDLSEMVGVDIGDDGNFAMPPSFATYWRGPDSPQRHPFLVRANGRLAGFALIKRIAADTHDVGEFFILRKFRRSGLGRDVACRLFDGFAGNWEVRELPTNTPAQAFWRRIIGEYTSGDFKERTEFFQAYAREFVVQRFRSR
jgi:predicted acetyltransferase